MPLTGDKIKAALNQVEGQDDFAAKLAKAIVDNIEIKVEAVIPAGAVTVGAGMASAPSAVAISCLVSVTVQ